MQLIREIRNIDSDKIIIKVPGEFRRRRVEILVLPLHESEEDETRLEDDPGKKI